MKAINGGRDEKRYEGHGGCGVCVMITVLILFLSSVLAVSMLYWDFQCKKEGYDGLKVGNFIQLTDEDVICEKITGFNEEDGFFDSEYKLLSDLREETDKEREQEARG